MRAERLLQTQGFFYFMAKDPAFLFYPGDYLRDTQCLSEKVQVAYDRIMCEHMRNICITYEQLNFFTKRLSSEEKAELLHVLTKVEGGYQISWVAESICKRVSYSESRRKNKLGKSKNISLSYVNHMENENVIVNEDELKGGAGGKLFDDLTEMEINNTIEYIHRTHQSKKIFQPPDIENYWKGFLLVKDKFYEDRSKVIFHFMNWLKKQDYEQRNNIGAKKSNSEARIEAYKNW